MNAEHLIWMCNELKEAHPAIASDIDAIRDMALREARRGKQPTFEDGVREALAACERVRLKAISPEHVHSLAHRVANATARECYNAILALLEKKP